MHGTSAWKGMVFSAIVGLAGDVGRDLVRRASRFHRRPAAYAVRLDSIADKLRPPCIANLFSFGRAVRDPWECGLLAGNASQGSNNLPNAVFELY